MCHFNNLHVIVFKKFMIHTDILLFFFGGGDLTLFQLRRTFHMCALIVRAIMISNLNFFYFSLSLSGSRSRFHPDDLKTCSGSESLDRMYNYIWASIRATISATSVLHTQPKHYRVQLHCSLAYICNTLIHYQATTATTQD